MFTNLRQLGVSIPENTKESPVMIVSELCANGDLFDYIRNVNAPSLYKVVGAGQRLAVMMIKICLAHHNVGYCAGFTISSRADSICHSSGL